MLTVLFFFFLRSNTERKGEIKEEKKGRKTRKKFKKYTGLRAEVSLPLPASPQDNHC